MKVVMYGLLVLHFAGLCALCVASIVVLTTLDFPWSLLGLFGLYKAAKYCVEDFADVFRLLADG